MRKRSAVLSSCLLLLWSSMAMAQKTASQVAITGEVIDAVSRKPVADAMVSLQIPGSKYNIHAFEVDAKGKFSIPWLGDALVTGEGQTGYPGLLLAEAPGYQTAQQSVVMFPGMEKKVTIALERELRIIRHTYSLKHRNPEEVAQSLQPLLAQGSAQPVPRLGLVEVRMLDVEKARVDSLMRLLDSPPAQFWIEVMIIRARAEGPAKMPAEIAPIARQLHRVFKFRQFELVGRASAMGLEGSTLQFESRATDSKLGLFGVNTQLKAIGSVIRLVNLSIRFSEAAGNNIMTTVNLKEGETIILGASQASQENEAIISVVQARRAEQ